MGLRIDARCCALAVADGAFGAFSRDIADLERPRRSYGDATLDPQ
jgi:hypothetical protein